MSHNGWKNYETWLVNLWLDNDELHQETLNEYAEENGGGINDLAERIKDYVDEVNEEILETPSMGADLVKSALEEVDWFEIAEHYHNEALSRARAS